MREPVSVPQPETSVLVRCTDVFEKQLKKSDRALQSHLVENDVAPQLFLLRWLRLLFAREFQLQDTVVLWSHLFADAYTRGSPYSSACPKTAQDVAKACAEAMPLVNFVAVAMIRHIKSDLMNEDNSGCLQRLMKYKPARVSALVASAVELRRISELGVPDSLRGARSELGPDGPLSAPKPTPSRASGRGYARVPPPDDLDLFADDPLSAARKPAAKAKTGSGRLGSVKGQVKDFLTTVTSAVGEAGGALREAAEQKSSAPPPAVPRPAPVGKPGLLPSEARDMSRRVSDIVARLQQSGVDVPMEIADLRKLQEELAARG